jgi:hypothetical protein
MNITGTIHYVKKTDIKKLVDEKVISPLALIPRVSNPQVYYDYYHQTPLSKDPVLDSIEKSTGYPNYNSRIYPRASQEYQSNTLKILVRHPIQYLMSVANEAYVFFGFFPYREFDNFKNWGSVRVHSQVDRILLDITAYPVPLIMCLLFVLAVSWLVKKLKADTSFSRASDQQQAVYALTVFIFFSMVYTFCLGISLDAGEANFLRIPIDPLFVSLAVLSVGGWLVKKFDWLKFLDKN